jgi:integrase
VGSVYQRVRKRRLKDGTSSTRRTWAIKYKLADGRFKTVETTYDTKQEAKLAAAALEKSESQKRDGVETDFDRTDDRTVGDLIRWWLDHIDDGEPSHKPNVWTLEKNLLSTKKLVPGKPFYKAHRLASLRLRDLTTGQVNLWLDERERAGDLAEQSVNHLRMYLIRAWGAAQSRDWLRRKLLCPALDAERRRIPKRLPSFLLAEQVPAMLRGIADHWRDFFAAAVYTGMRKGELGGLLKADVDFRGRLIRVGHSYERDTTKGGDEDAIPLHPELVPYLEHAMAQSKGDHVFQTINGTDITRSTKLDDVLHAALRRGSVVTGYVDKCRRKGCGYRHAESDDADRWCPQKTAGGKVCGFKLMSVGVPKKLRFHDLRHTTASLLLMAGVDLFSVSRVLRHSDPKITAKVYGHLEPNWLHEKISRLKLNPL